MEIATDEWILTGDSTWTLKSAKYAQTMHSTAGAGSESCLVYGEALDLCLGKMDAISVLSLGLGLGYLELMVAAYAIKFPNIRFSIQSYENEKKYIDSFLSWLNDEAILPDWQKAYDTSLVFFENRLEVSNIKKWLKNSNWVIGGPFQKYQVIFYDYFSQDSHPEVWAEDYLKSFLANTADSKCVFSTYASTRALKRALKESGFNLLDRKGFAGKRERTLAKNF